MSLGVPLIYYLASGEMENGVGWLMMGCGLSAAIQTDGLQTDRGDFWGYYNHF